MKNFENFTLESSCWGHPWRPSSQRKPCGEILSGSAWENTIWRDGKLQSHIQSISTNSTNQKKCKSSRHIPHTKLESWIKKNKKANNKWKLSWERKKVQDLKSLWVNIVQHKKKKYFQFFSNPSRKINTKWIFPNVLSSARISLYQAKTRNHRREKLQLNIPNEYRNTNPPNKASEQQKRRWEVSHQDQVGPTWESGWFDRCWSINAKPHIHKTEDRRPGLVPLIWKKYLTKVNIVSGSQHPKIYTKGIYLHMAKVTGHVTGQVGTVKLRSPLLRSENKTNVPLFTVSI